MVLPPLLLQTAGSLAAILALAGLAKWMNLGGAALLEDDATVRRAAGEVEDGFDPIAVARTADSRAALARDDTGRIMVIKCHGNRFAGRVLGPAACASIRQNRNHPTLAVDSGEARFGTVNLELPDADTWAAAINALDDSRDV